MKRQFQYGPHSETNRNIMHDNKERDTGKPLRGAERADKERDDDAVGIPPGSVPEGREEERRGNELPTHPDLMGPYPDVPATQGSVLGRDEQEHPPAVEGVRGGEDDGDR
jgi:hypothetical protein